jgi:hypothetical protein
MIQGGLDGGIEASPPGLKCDWGIGKLCFFSVRSKRYAWTILMRSFDVREHRKGFSFSM